MPDNPAIHPDAGRSSASRRISAVLLLGAYLVLAVLFYTPWLSPIDGVGYFSITRSLVLDGDLDLRNERDHFRAVNGADPHFGVGPGGVVWNEYPIGWPLLELPGFLLAHALVRLGLAPGLADGYGEAYVAGATSMSLLLGLLGLWMLLRLAASLCGRGPAAALATFTLLGTPLFFYVLLDPSMSHAAGFCAATLFLHAWLRVERSQAGAASFQPAGGSRQTRNWALVGLAGGVLVLVRLQELVWAVLPAISLWRGLRRAADSRQRWVLVRRAGVAAAVFSALIAPQIGVWWYWTGSLTPTYLAGAGHRLDLSSPHFLDTWLSPDHGLFYWHPLLVLCLIGLLPWRRRALGWPMLATFLAITWLVGSWSSWSGAQSFGHRMFVSALPLLALGGAALWRRGRLAPTLAALGVAWNLALLGVYGARMIPAEAPVSHAEMLAAMSQLPARGARILHGFYANREQYTHPPAGAALPTQPDL